MNRPDELDNIDQYISFSPCDVILDGNYTVDELRRIIVVMEKLKPWSEKKLEDMTEPELRILMNTICVNIEKAGKDLNTGKLNFVVLVFNDPKIVQYAANCTRSSIIEAMKECATRLEHSQNVPR